MSKYEELIVPTWGISLSKLEDFIRRARASGHNSFDLSANRGWYDDIDDFRLESGFSASVEAEEKAATT